MTREQWKKLGVTFLIVVGLLVIGWVYDHFHRYDQFFLVHLFAIIWIGGLMGIFLCDVLEQKGFIVEALYSAPAMTILALGLVGWGMMFARLLLKFDIVLGG